MMKPKLSTILINATIPVILSQGSCLLNQTDYLALSQPTKETAPRLLKDNQEGKENDAETYFNWGVARYKQGDKEGAISDYNRAIQINPNYALAYYNRGVVRDELGDNAYYNRGNVRDDLGDKPRAIQDLQKAAELFKQQGNQQLYQLVLDLLRRLQ